MVTEVMGGGALVAGRRNQTPTDLSNKEGFLTHLGKKKGMATGELTQQRSQ